MKNLIIDTLRMGYEEILCTGGEQFDQEIIELEKASIDNEEFAPDNIVIYQQYENGNLADLMEVVTTEKLKYDLLIKKVLKLVKTGLIDMAVRDELPLDLNELDITTLFETYNNGRELITL